MNLGKIFVIKEFKRTEQTTWIIDKLNRKFATEKYDTIKLGWSFSIIVEDAIYPISLFVQERNYDIVSPCEIVGFEYKVCGRTMSNIKKTYIERGFDSKKCKSDAFLKTIYNAFESFGNLQNGNYIQLDNPICFKAQSSYDHESEGFGKGCCYSIVAIDIGNPIKKS